MGWLSAKWKLALMLAPSVIVFSVFVVYPVLYSLGYSFTNFSGFGDTTFVGLENYRQLSDDQFFWVALRNTLVILVIGVVILVPASFGLALLLRVKVRGAGLLRSLVFAPMPCTENTTTGEPGGSASTSSPRARSHSA